MQMLVNVAMEQAVGERSSCEYIAAIEKEFA